MLHLLIQDEYIHYFNILHQLIRNLVMIEAKSKIMKIASWNLWTNNKRSVLI